MARDETVKAFREGLLPEIKHIYLREAQYTPRIILVMKVPRESDLSTSTREWLAQYPGAYEIDWAPETEIFPETPVIDRYYEGIRATRQEQGRYFTTYDYYMGLGKFKGEQPGGYIFNEGDVNRIIDTTKGGLLVLREIQPKEHRR